MSASEKLTGWYSVRCLFRTPCKNGFSYEERVTLWRAASFDDAIGLAEAEGLAYAADVSDEVVVVEYIGLAQSYWLADEPEHGAEVFSLIRDSDLKVDDYVSRYFDTGAEHQRKN